MVSASHNPAEDNGLKVLDARGIKLDDDREDALEALIWRAEELAGPRNAGLGRVDGRAATCSSAIVADRLGLARPVRTDLRIVLDCANGVGRSCGARDPGRHRGERRGDLQRARRRQHQRRVRRDGAGGAGPGGRRAGRRPGLRPRRRCRPAGRGRPPRAGRRRRPADRPDRPRPHARGGPCRTGRRGRDGALERRPRGGGRGRRRPGRPDPGRRQVHPRGDAGERRQSRRREERPRDRPRSRVLGRRPGDRPGAARRARPERPGRSTTWPPRSPSSHSSNGPSAFVTRTSGRATRSSAGRSPTARERLGAGRPDPRPTVGHRARPAGHGRGSRRSARAPSWPTEIATLAGERLH